MSQCLGLKAIRSELYIYDDSRAVLLLLGEVYGMLLLAMPVISKILYFAIDFSVS